MAKPSVERLIYAKVPRETAVILAPMVEALNDCLRIYQESSTQKWRALGLHKKEPKWKFWANREKRLEEFNRYADELKGEEVILPEAVPVENLHGLVISSVDLVILKSIGVLRA